MTFKYFNGLFIIFEGIDGSGKSSNILFLKKQMLLQNNSCIISKTIGGSKTGIKIKNIILKKSNHEKIHKYSEILLFFAARIHESYNIIKPALNKGITILSDRFNDTSYTYQGIARSIHLSTIKFLEKTTLPVLKPKIILLFDMPATIAIKRIKKRYKLDNIEYELISLLEKIRQAYLLQANANVKQYKIINATLSKKNVYNILLKYLKILKNRHK